jgi:hypothetical protein
MSQIHTAFFRRQNAHIEMTLGTEGGNTGASTTHRDWLAPAIFSDDKRAQKAF